MSEQRKELANDFFERFLNQPEEDPRILPDIDLLAEVGIRHKQWSSFTRDEQIAVRDVLVEMSKSPKIVDEGWVSTHISPENAKTIQDMLRSERLHPRLVFSAFAGNND